MYKVDRQSFGADLVGLEQKDHRLRVALSSSYWPLVWPSPEAATLTVYEGVLELPLRGSGTGDEWRFAAPEAAAAWQTETLREPSHKRETSRDPRTGVVTLEIVDDFGEVRDSDHGLATGSVGRESWSIDPADPLSAHGTTHWTESLSRSGWSVHTETYTAMRSDAKNFHVSGRIEAFEGSKLVFSREFEEVIPRHCV